MSRSSQGKGNVGDLHIRWKCSHHITQGCDVQDKFIELQTFRVVSRFCQECQSQNTFSCVTTSCCWWLGNWSLTLFDSWSGWHGCRWHKPLRHYEDGEIRMLACPPDLSYVTDFLRRNWDWDSMTSKLLVFARHCCKVETECLSRYWGGRICRDWEKDNAKGQ